MKSTRLFRNFILLFSAFFSSQTIFGVEYKILRETDENNGPWYQVPDGKIAEIEYFNYQDRSKLFFKSPEVANGSAITIAGYQFGSADQIKGVRFEGPCEFQLDADHYNYGGNIICILKITDNIPETNSITKYASVIPENAKTNVSVILEQSTDLVNWTAANPGDFTPSTSKRFFRVRTANVPVAITGASNAAPIVITSAGHGLSTGDAISVSGVAGNTAANGVFTITKVDDNSFSLNGTTGNAAYTSGGTWLPSP
jgi:hypothetical protein